MQLAALLLEKAAEINADEVEDLVGRPRAMRARGRRKGGS
jgi:hypothetical protein